jgi:hypothetical protein
MELGLRISTSKARRYYPVSVIRERGLPSLDRTDGGSALIYIDPETSNPPAVFVNAKDLPKWMARRFTWMTAVRQGGADESKRKAAGPSPADV